MNNIVRAWGPGRKDFGSSSKNIYLTKTREKVKRKTPMQTVVKITLLRE